MTKKWILAAALALAAAAGGVAFAKIHLSSDTMRPMSCGTTNDACKWQDDCCPGYYCGGPSPPSCQPKGH